MWRQVRLATAVMLVLMAFVVRVGLTTFDSAGGAKGMTAFMDLLRNPAMNALYGRATSLATAGAFVVWRMGMYLALGAALWAGLAATRLTRSAEDDGTWDLLVIGVTGRRPALKTAIIVVAEGGVGAGAVTFLGLMSGSQSVTGSTLFGAALAGVAWFGGAIGLLCAQLFAPRRSCSQIALVSVGLMFLLRMLADGSLANGWLRWLTPFGWLENVDSFGHRSWAWTLPLLIVPALAIAAALWIQGRRDIGGALWVHPDRSRAHVMLLASPWRFAWRERRSSLVAWAVGLAAIGVVVGYLTDALVSFSRSNPAYARLLNQWGYGSMITVKGFVAEVGVMMALALSFLVVTLLTMVSADNLQGRLEVPFATGTGRVKWLSANLAATSLGLLVVALASAVAMWAGAEFSGSSVALSVTLKGMLNSVSVAPLIVGVAATFVVWLPRFAFTAMAALLSLCYVISMLGPILHWPTWLLDVSPFHFLHLVPSEAPNWGATTMFFLIGAALTTVASIGFARGDLGR